MIAWDFKWKIIENSPMAYTLNQVVVQDDGFTLDFILVDSNPAFEKRLGIKLSELKGKSLSEWLFNDSNNKKYWMKEFTKIVNTSGRKEFPDLLVYKNR